MHFDIEWWTWPESNRCPKFILYIIVYAVKVKVFVFSNPPDSCFWTSPVTTDTSLFFGCGQAAIWYSKLLFIFNWRWLRHQSSAIIYFKTLSKPFQALKGGRLPPRPQGNNQVSSFNLTHLVRVAQIVSEYLTALPPLCEVSLLGVPKYTALFSYWLLMLVYWLLVDTEGFEPYLSHCKWDALPVELPTHMRPSPHF